MSRRTLALVLAMLAVGAVCVRLAWLSDDAYITLRSVENWVRGNGLRWNAADRVQTFTHPLWMLLLAVGRWLTGEVYFTAIALGLMASLTAVFLQLRNAAGPPAIVAVAALLIASRGFADYTTSGLETPLSCLLLVLFVAANVRDDVPERRLLRVVLLASLLAMTRLDFALLVAPAVIAAMRAVPWRRVLLLGALGSAPLSLWLAIAWIWYGSPLPVTAHAKLFGVGIPVADLAMQGLYYVWHTLLHDPVLVLTLAAGVAVGLRDPRTRWLAAGAVLYVAYVVKVGGDFMAGRFLVPPFAVAITIVAPRLARGRARTAAMVAVVALAGAFVHGWPAWLRAPSSDTPPTPEQVEAARGIGDERRVYYSKLGLLSPTRAAPRWGELHDAVWPQGRADRWFLVNGAVGVAGYQVGERGHVIDPVLCDPLLARLPARDPARWRIGHVLRRVPEGYYETLASGENRLQHPGLHAYVDALRLVTQAPVFAGERWAALGRLAAGDLDGGLRAFVAGEYRSPPRRDVAAVQLPPELPPGTYWFDEPRLVVVYEGGLAVRLAAPRSARTVRVQTSGLFAFRCRFVRDGEVLGDATGVRTAPPPGIAGLRAVAGLRDETIAVPAGLAAFDTLWIDAVETPETHMTPVPAAIGAITFVE